MFQCFLRKLIIPISGLSFAKEINGNAHVAHGFQNLDFTTHIFSLIHWVIVLKIS